MVYEVMCHGCYESITCLHFDLMVALFTIHSIARPWRFFIRVAGALSNVRFCMSLELRCPCTFTRDLDGAWLIAELSLAV